MNAKTVSSSNGTGTAPIKKRRIPDDSSQPPSSVPSTSSAPEEKDQIVYKKGKGEGQDPRDILNRIFKNADSKVVIEILEDEAVDTLLDDDETRKIIADKVSGDKTGKLSEFVQNKSEKSDKWLQFCSRDMNDPQASLEDILSTGIINVKIMPDTEKGVDEKPYAADILTVVRKLLRKGADIHKLKRDGGPYFYESVLRSPNLLTALIGMEVPLSRLRKTDEDGGRESILCEAFRLEAWDALKILLDREDPSYHMYLPKNEEPMEAIDWILDKNHPKGNAIVLQSKYVLKRDCGYPPVFFQPERMPTATMLHHSIVDEKFNLFKAILKHGTAFVRDDTKLPTSSGKKHTNYYNALHIAAYFGKVEHLKNLLECEIEKTKKGGKMKKVYKPLINMPGPEPDHLTPLYLACLNNKPKNVKFLLANGADPCNSNPPDSSDLPDLLSMCGQIGHSECLFLLLDSKKLKCIEPDKDGLWFWNYFMPERSNTHPVGIQIQHKTVATMFSNFIRKGIDSEKSEKLDKRAMEIRDEWVINQGSRRPENPKKKKPSATGPASARPTEGGLKPSITGPTSAKPTENFSFLKPTEPIKNGIVQKDKDKDAPLPAPLISNGKISPQQSLRSVQNQH